jgi:hypothetical protein
MALTRRDVLRTAALGACALAAASMTGCRGLVRDELDDGLPPAGRVPHLDPVPAELLRWAALAPSSRNAQPWRVRIAGAQDLIFGIDPARRLPAVDPPGHQSLIGLGAFLECFSLAAAVRGLHATAVLIAQDTGASDIVRVTLQAAPPRDLALTQLVERRTQRVGYSPRELRSADLRRLLAPFAGQAVAVAPASAPGRMLAGATVEATRLQAARREARLELAEWIRWRDADARTHRDGLTPASMEITGLANWWVRATHSRADVLAPGFGQRTVDVARIRVKECGAWLVVTSEDASPGALLATGRRFLQMALMLRGLGLAAHPMLQAAEEPETREALAPSLGLASPVRMLLRVGYAKPAREAVSLRRPVSWFVTA